MLGYEPRSPQQDVAPQPRSSDPVPGAGTTFDWAWAAGPDVRLHTDAQAARLADDLGARAFTHGNDVYFARGEFAPETEAGARLLRHELTHVAQQSTGEVPRGTIQLQAAEDEPLNPSDVVEWYAMSPAAENRLVRQVTAEESTTGDVHRTTYRDTSTQFLTRDGLRAQLEHMTGPLSPFEERLVATWGHDPDTVLTPLVAVGRKGIIGYLVDTNAHSTVGWRTLYSRLGQPLRQFNMEPGVVSEGLGPIDYAMLVTGAIAATRLAIAKVAAARAAAAEAAAIAAETRAAASSTAAVAADEASTAGEVWVNTRSNVYHRPGSRFYGATAEGRLMTEAEAEAAGARAARTGGGGTRPAAQASAAPLPLTAEQQALLERVELRTPRQSVGGYRSQIVRSGKNEVVMIEGRAAAQLPQSESLAKYIETLSREHATHAAGLQSGENLPEGITSAPASLNLSQMKQVENAIATARDRAAEVGASVETKSTLIVEEQNGVRVLVGVKREAWVRLPGSDTTFEFAELEARIDPVTRAVSILKLKLIKPLR